MIVFDVMFADTISNKTIESLVTELFICGNKINIYFAFITNSYFAFQEIIKLSNYFIMKIPNKGEL